MAEMRIDQVKDENVRLRAVNAQLLQSLQQLHDNIAEYARINNLGGFDNQDMVMARAALAAARVTPRFPITTGCTSPCSRPVSVSASSTNLSTGGSMVAKIVHPKLPIINQLRPGWILQFRGEQAILAPRLLPGFSRVYVGGCGKS